MKTAVRIQIFEIVLYTVIFVSALGITLYTGRSIRGDWMGAAIDWLRILPFVLVFAVNNFLLCPRLLFKEKYTLYLISCLALVTLSALLGEGIKHLIEGMGSPVPFGPPRGEMGPGGPPGHPGGGPPAHFYFGMVIAPLLLIGFNTGVKVFVRYAQEKISQGEREWQYLSTELAYLRNQISPHFLMNTLNNIHALVETDKGRAQDAIIKLSKMMRYLLYETEPDRVPLAREMEFIESYIELMRLRYDSREVEVALDYTRDGGAAQVPAFLLLTFVENAFKHGIRTGGSSFIRIAVSTRGGHVVFSIENSVGDRRHAHPEASGIGIENVRKRLEILYGNFYELDIHNDGATHKVTLEIPA